MIWFELLHLKFIFLRFLVNQTLLTVKNSIENPKKKKKKKKSQLANRED